MAAVSEYIANRLVATRGAAQSAADVGAGMATYEKFVALSFADNLGEVLITLFRDLMAAVGVLNHHWLWAREAVFHARFGTLVAAR